MKEKGTFVVALVLAFIAIIMTVTSMGLADECTNLKEGMSIMDYEEPAPFIHIDDNSGFISTPDIMASFEMFDGRSGQEYWVRVERYGFGKAHEFSVDTIQEAEMILRGLM